MGVAASERNGQIGASSNFGNMFSVLGASAFLPYVPMAPLQVLTNNVLNDFSQSSCPDRFRWVGTNGTPAAVASR
jgi:hypothetical protein